MGKQNHHFLAFVSVGGVVRYDDGRTISIDIVDFGLRTSVRGGDYCRYLIALQMEQLLRLLSGHRKISSRLTGFKGHINDENLLVASEGL